MHIKQEVTTYTALADWYDTHYRANGTWPTSEAYAQVLLDLMRQSGLPARTDLRLLDVACGGGFYLRYSRDAFAVRCGCDISRVALAEARQHDARLALCQANAEALPYASASFDVVTCLGSLEHFLQPERALAEMRRVVTSEGLVMILVPTNPDWAIYDVQPTEIVLDAGAWDELLGRCGLRTVASVATDQHEQLKAASGGCQVFCARPA